jgi:hypothetical protein
MVNYPKLTDNFMGILRILRYLHGNEHYPHGRANPRMIV